MKWVKEENVDDSVLSHHEEYSWGAGVGVAIGIAAFIGVKTYMIDERITNALAWSEALKLLA